MGTKADRKQSGVEELALVHARHALADVYDAASRKVAALLERHPELLEGELMSLLDEAIGEAASRLGSYRPACESYFQRRAVALRLGEEGAYGR